MKTQLDKAGARFLFFKSSSLISLEMIALSRQICSAASPERPRGNARAPSARLGSWVIWWPSRSTVLFAVTAKFINTSKPKYPVMSL